MSFGLNTTKFRIFRSPMQLSLKNVSKVVEVCARLHNFIIDQQRPDLLSEPIERYTGVENMTEEEELAGYVPGEPDEFPTDPLLSVSGTSELRVSIRNWIKDQGLQRPDHNLERRQQEQDSANNI